MQVNGGNNKIYFVRLTWSQAQWKTNWMQHCTLPSLSRNRETSVRRSWYVKGRWQWWLSWWLLCWQMNSVCLNATMRNVYSFRPKGRVGIFS